MPILLSLRTPTVRSLMLLVPAAILLAACGGDESASVADPVALDAAPVESDISYGDPGTGRIDIGNLRHDLTVERCLAMFGALSGSAVSVTEPANVSVHFEFAPADWRRRDPSEGWEEAGTIRARTEEPYQQWETGQSAVSMYNLGGINAASLDITSLEIAANGRSARGEALFIESGAIMGGAPEAVRGAFRFVCPQD